jgi:hypothetical protein
MYFCLFSDKRLALKSFSRSQSLPYPQNYKFVGKNPILSCLLDQMKHDQELSINYASQTALIDDITSALETGRIQWPSAFNLMSSEQWIQKMRANPKFYLHHARNSSEMREYENILLDLAAQCLKSEIQLIPFLEQDEGSVFKSRFTTGSRLFSIMACQTLFRRNFFVSIEKEQCTPE